MAARKNTINISGPATPTDNIAAPHQGIAADQLDADIENVLSEIGESGGAVVLWREKDAQPGNYEYLVRQPAKGFTLEYVRENFGGGNYKGVPIDPVHGALNPVFFSIDRRWIGKAFSNAAPAVAGSSRDDQFRDRMTEILLTSLVAQRQQPPAAPQRDPLLEMLLTALVNRDNGGGSATEMVKTMMEAATTMAAAMNPPEGMAGVLTGLLPAVDKLASAHVLGARRAAVARVLPPSPATAPGNVSHPVATVPNPSAIQTSPATVAGTIFPKWLEPFRSLAPRLVSLADKDANPELYADLVIDALMDDENESALRGAIDAMQAGTLLDDVCNAVPQMKDREERRVWLATFVEAVRAGLMDLIQQENETAPTDESASA